MAKRIELSHGAYRALCGLVHPSDVIDPATVVAEDAEWAELRALFPEADARIDAEFDRISADSIEAGDVITLNEGGAVNWAAEPRTVKCTRQGGTRVQVDFVDGEPGASFAFDEIVWRAAVDA